MPIAVVVITVSFLPYYCRIFIHNDWVLGSQYYYISDSAELSMSLKHQQKIMYLQLMGAKYNFTFFAVKWQLLLLLIALLSETKYHNKHFHQVVSLLLNETVYILAHTDSP